MSASEIPKLVQDLILKNRKHFHKLDAEMRQKTNGQAGFSTKPLTLKEEKTFWNIKVDDDLEDFLFEDLLPALFDQTELSGLPPGYDPLVHVLEFERHCDFEGWYAVSNKTKEEMQHIIDSYKVVGLHEESEALREVLKSYLQLADSEEEKFSDILSAAYRKVPNSTSEPEDRVSILLDYVRSNPKTFC